jgi:hypothetical protein
VIEEDLRTKLIEDNTLRDLFEAQGVDPTSLGAVSYNHTPEVAPDTRIYFVRSETTNENLLTGLPVIEHAFYPVECVSPDLSTSMQFARALQNLNTFRGPMGDTFVQAIDVSDQSDEYVYKYDYADEGLAVSPVRIEVMI